LVSDCELPFCEAVTEAVWSVAIDPAVAVKVAVLDPAATLTVAGTVSSGLLLDSDPVAAALNAFDSVTVQVEVAAEPRLAGVHESRLTTACDTSEMVADCELPFSEAVTEAVWSVAIDPAVAVKFAVFEPVPTVTVAGTVSSGLLLDSETVAAAATPLESVTVHVDVAADPRLAGEQASKLTTTGAVSEMDTDCDAPFSEAVTTAV
jgi:hypothetical protein